MPDPREAIYDVLRAKWEREQDQAELARWNAEWAAYQAGNERAAEADRFRRRG